MLRVLRRQPGALSILASMLFVAVICALILWKAHELRLGLYVLGGFLGVAALSALLVLAVLRLLSRLRTEGGMSWRYGVANLRRHALGNTLQVVALGLGIMALLTLTLIRGDLLHSRRQPCGPIRRIVFSSTFSLIRFSRSARSSLHTASRSRSSFRWCADG
jgi:putative ABC transport system permease protein